MKYLLFLTSCLLVLLPTSNATTYRLQRVSSVETGKKYVFEQGGYVMNNSISSNALVTTNSFKTFGLSDNETYVWEFDSNSRLKNINKSQFLCNENDCPNLLFGSSSEPKYKWTFENQADGTFMIKNNNSKKFLAFTQSTETKYKAYPNDLGRLPHSIVVYQLIEETKNSPELKFSRCFDKILVGDDYTPPTLSKASGLTSDITYSSSNNEVATVNATTGELSIVGAGHVVITATSAANETYDAGEANYSLMVMGGDGSESKPYCVKDFISGYIPWSGNFYVTGMVVGCYHNTSFDSTGTSDTHLALVDKKDSEQRIPIPLPTNLQSAYGLKSNPRMKGSKVKISGSPSLVYTLTSLSGAITISVLSYSIDVSSALYATYSTSNALDFSGTGVYPYTAAVVDDYIQLSRITSGKVPANTGVVLYSEAAGNYEIPVTAEADAVDGNELLISDGSTAKGDGIYVLANIDGEVGFRRWTSGSSLSKGRIYLKTSASARDFIGFNKTETGIEKVESGALKVLCKQSEQARAESCYDLQGRRVAQPTKGLYIMNGKKVVVR